MRNLFTTLGLTVGLTAGLTGSLLMTLLAGSARAELLLVRSIDWASWLDSDWLMAIHAPHRQANAPAEISSDPTATDAIQQHLADLAAVGMPAAEQGVWIQSGNQILAEHQGSTPIPAASLTKIPTTLAALTTWGTDRQFDTVVGVAGTLQGGVVQGDLVVTGGGDPLFVWEEAIALGNALNQRGIQRITGKLIIVGNFAMNFKGDPQTAGKLLKQGLNASLWTDEVATQYAQLPPGTRQPSVIIEGPVEAVSQSPGFVPVMRHRSLPLVQILKAMNIFSNNFIADSVAEQLGGGAAVARQAAAAAQVDPAEVQLINGSGLGTENRISPRAIASMLITIQTTLRSQQLSVADLFPVVGRERGTLGNRQIIPGAAVKTGTLNEVSSLAGVLPTRDQGLVWFTIIDIGTGSLSTLHTYQDELLQTLVTQWGAGLPIPPDLQPSDRLKLYEAQLGDPTRNQPL